jgi:hypothetical protein
MIRNRDKTNGRNFFLKKSKKIGDDGCSREVLVGQWPLADARSYDPREVE